MRSIWDNVAERVYENDIAQGTSRYGTPRIGPDEPTTPSDLSTLGKLTPRTTSPAEPVPAKKTRTPTKLKAMETSESLPSTVVTKKPKTDREDGWKPVSLSTPTLITVVFLTLLLAAAVETLAQRSKAEGGLALSRTLDEMPQYAWICYLYMPNIVAAIYSIIWSWIDLDAKRMQPWLELSKPNGAMAKDSMFLDYPHDFVAFVPLRAARRKHWPVFFSGTAMVIVFWLLTPMQSALLGTDSVKQANSATIGARSELQALGNQEALLNTAVLNTAYAISWLDQPYSPFMTSNYAILPFYLENPDVPDAVASNWTANSTKLSTDLTCWPAEISRNGVPSKVTFDFLNGQGCNATIGLDKSANYSMLYIGYNSSPYSSYALAGPACAETSNSTHQFLAIWSKPTGHADFNLTAVYCQTQYYKQQVSVSVESATLEVIEDSIQTLGPREILSEKEFNSTAFEYLLGNGMEENVIDSDYPFNLVVEQQPRLNQSGITRPASNMVGYALAGRDLAITAYSDPDILAKAYHDAHQHLFSVAVNQLLVNTSAFSDETGSAEFYLHGVVVSRLFATMVESLLGVTALFTALTLWFIRTSRSNLPHNPSSLRRYIDIFRHSPELLRQFRSMDNANEPTLLKEFEDDRFTLLRKSSSKRVQVTMDEPREIAAETPRRDLGVQKGYLDPAKPWVLKRLTGSMLVMSLVAAIASLYYLKSQEKKLNGLQRPSENFEVLQLLENYIPTIFATLLEPVWILLNRMLCVLQPFKELWQGKARASVSLDATYTSIPPQLALWRAIKARHLTLVTFCTMALLANVLSVGLGSLFNEAPVTAAYKESLPQAFGDRFDNSSVYNFGTYMSQNLITTGQYQDHYYIALANMSSGTPLPPWVSKDYFFQRYDLTQVDHKTDDTYNLRTRGFGVEANCTPIAAFSWPTNLTAPDTDTNECGNKNLVDKAIVQSREGMEERPSGVSAIEYVSTWAVNNPYPSSCEVPLTLGWGRSDQEKNLNLTVLGGFLVCRPSFQTAMFNLTVDASGRVVRYHRTSDVETTLDYPESKKHTDILLENANHQWSAGNFRWHNDSLAHDWMNYLIVLAQGSRDTVSPQKGTPDPEELAPVVDYIYRLLFGILLSRNEQLFSQAATGASTTATRHTEEVRIFMEDTSFYISIVVLALNVAVAFGFYIRSVAFVLPRMPTTLGSILAYLAPSRLASSSSKYRPGFDRRTFSFGRYVGQDGQAYIGVELDPYVVPVDLASLTDGSGFRARLRGMFKRHEGELKKNGTWL